MLPLGTKVIWVDPPPRSRAATVFSGLCNRSRQLGGVGGKEKKKELILTCAKSKIEINHRPRRKLIVNQEKSPSSIPSMMLTERGVTMNPDSSKTRRTYTNQTQSIG